MYFYFRKFHEDNKKVLFYNLEKNDESHTQKFIKIYQGLEKVNNLL